MIHIDERQIGKEIIAVTNMIKRILPGRAERHPGLERFTGMQRMFIGYIADHSGTSDVFQRDLEIEFMIRRPTATGILQIMERDGLISREQAAYDARLKKIVLTQKALELHRSIKEEIDLTEKKLSKGLTKEERDAFFAIIEKKSNKTQPRRNKATLGACRFAGVKRRKNP